MGKFVTSDPQKVVELLQDGYLIYWLSKWETSKTYTYCLSK